MRYADKLLKKLKMSKGDMCINLVSVLAGQAKTLVVKSDHSEGDFILAMKKL